MLLKLKTITSFFVLLYSFSDILYAQTMLYKYAINLESSQNKKNISIDLKEFNVSSDYKIYQTEVSLGRNKSFFRLRLGFFKSKKEANRVARKFMPKFSKLWVDRLHKQDRDVLEKWVALRKKRPAIIKDGTRAREKTASKDDKEKIAEKLMTRANDAMKDKKYRLAAGIYTRIIGLGNTSKHQQAMEFLGLAREKNGQLIHARADYRLYLKTYSSGEDAARVRQRLLSLKTLLLMPRKRLKNEKSKRSDGRFFGSVLQFYRKDVVAERANETLSTNVNFLYRKHTDSLNIKSQFNVNNFKYLNNSLNNDKSIVNTLFIDVADGNNIKSIRLGRQSHNKGGVLGRMDGAWLRYRINPTWRLNMVAGYPVLTSISNNAQKNRLFWGVSADIGTISKYWNFNIYTIKQEIDSIVDRNAVGGEVRYRKGQQNHFALVDYDIHFSDLNTFYYVGNWHFDNKAAVVITLNKRNSPILTSFNATQGQVTQSIDALLQIYTEAELHQFAKDRTAKYNSATVSTTIPLDNKWSFIADGTVSNFSATPASADVAATEGTGNEYFYNAQFVGYNVFNADETSIYQYRYDDTKTFERIRLTVSTRFKSKNNKWRFRPEITLENRINSNGGTKRLITTGLKLDYKVKRKLKLELDVSFEKGKTDFPVSFTENNYYISAGFIWDF